MTRYIDTTGRSGIDSFEIRDKSILVRFKHSRTIYVYNYDIPGKEHVEEMKRLAAAGSNLATYISREVKGRYAKQL